MRCHFFIGLVSIFLPATACRADFILAAPIGFPGNNVNNNTPTLLFRGNNNSLVQTAVIPPSPFTSLRDPISAAFNKTGELFIGNRQGSQNSTTGSISRFTVDVAGNYVHNGAIVGNHLLGVHGLAFSKTGELFAGNINNQTISRFVFDGFGNAIPNGVIHTGPVAAVLGLAFSPWGELFVTTYKDIRRYVFDPNTGNAVFNGSFVAPVGNPFLHFLEFAPWGELFVPDLGNAAVYRFVFDAGHNPIFNGFVGLANPVGIAFDRMGDMYVSAHGSGGISRYRFDGNGNAALLSFNPTDSLGDIASYQVPEPGSLTILGLGVIALLSKRLWGWGKNCPT